MPETSPTSRQVMLLILITGLFAAVWSTDSGHKETPSDQPGSHSRSAVAILLQATAVEQQVDGILSVDFADDTEIGCPRGVVQSRVSASSWIATAVRGIGECHYPDGFDAADIDTVDFDGPVEAPLPGQLESQAMLTDPPIDAPIPAVVALDIPVEAPIPVVDAEPVIAPVPLAATFALVERKDRMPVFSSVAYRAKMDYRMTCHCCREFFGIAVRKVAALGRQSQQAVSDIAESVSEVMNGIDWKSRLASEPAEDSETRF
ncbi:MAG: hypothetical protein HON53_12790 [Planctomycetaceae bacterium]|nr:hypothetical protein [Planctomycetaceae bacterium]MBT6155372.1 hypothetical protein [Planctomycetaceae bacterium]MBT6487290.1 hypothetical protein [Planctomycetaceae bacterium]MBT6493687.1 hypothetical protein [Planctomycetaceae bacterium]